MESLRSQSIKIFKTALFQVDAFQAVLENLSLKGNILRIKTGSDSLKEWDLSRFKKIQVLGAGKSAAPMAAAAEVILKDRLGDGLIITKYGHGGRLSKIKIIEAGHPLPDQAGCRGTRQIVTRLQASGSGDLILFLTSGGCSALFTSPPPSISLKEKQKTISLLLKAGAPIQDLNTVRKHLSLVKGGRSARFAYPATVINLVLSDVIGDPLDIIGSGPFFPDSSSFQNALDVLWKYRLIKKVPTAISAFLKRGVRGLFEDTPQPGEICFKKVTHRIIANNRIALDAAAQTARKLGFKTFILSSQIQGEARELAKFYGALARERVQPHTLSKNPVCLLAGGEPTVTVTGPGKGGRNTELALATAIELNGLGKISFLSAGTDGTDGPTDAAGAVVDGRTCTRAFHKGIAPEDHLQNNDSYSFFKKAGGLLMTGPTGTNVMDLHILLVR
ncbi:MAG: glycerate kinase [Deltaproteobacteria bacterium]|nr:glycerate kinase [Deltaproteobacteria bacterium]